MKRVCGKDVAVTHADLVPCQQAGASPARPVSGLSRVCSETCLSKSKVMQAGQLIKLTIGKCPADALVTKKQTCFLHYSLSLSAQASQDQGLVCKALALAWGQPGTAAKWDIPLFT